MVVPAPLESELLYIGLALTQNRHIEHLISADASFSAIWDAWVGHFRDPSGQKTFAAELEQCMFDGYAEHDKAGNLAPGSSYK